MSRLPTAPVASIACGNPFAACLIGLRPSPQDSSLWKRQSRRNFDAGDERHLVGLDHGERRRDRRVSGESGSSDQPDHNPDQAEAFSCQSAGRPLKRSPAPVEPPMAFVPCLAVARLITKTTPAHPDISSSNSWIQIGSLRARLHNPFAPFFISTLRTGYPEPFLHIVRATGSGTISCTVRKKAWRR